MKRFFLFLFAAIAGLLCGALLGFVIGLATTTAFNTTSFEGYSGYLVFTTFVPLGALAGLIAGPFYAARKLRGRDGPNAPAD